MYFRALKNEETTMCLEHTFTGNRFFFICFDSHSNTYPLTPLHLATRIEAAKRHWRAHWACRLTLAHPGLGLVEDHPSRLLSPGCLDQFMTPTRGRGGQHCRHFRRQVAESWTCFCASCLHTSVYFLIVYYPDKFSVTILSVIAMLQQTFYTVSCVFVKCATF